VNIKVLAAESSFTENSSINIGDLLDGAAIFVEADIESLTLELQDDFNAAPSAMVKVGLGLWKNTTLKIRFVPKQSGPEYEFSTFGIEMQHDLKQWIPFVRRLPFDISALVAWNDTKSKAFLDSENEPNQSLEFNTKTFLFQI
tara:strand:- start:170 stop:598 length:429 start_codon:yes stop_codon:yes gene_type:complete